MLFQYQGLAKPVVTPAALVAPELSWQPSYPDRVPVRATPQAWPEYPLQPPAVAVAPELSWGPSFPDRVPIVRPTWAQVTAGRIDPFAPLGWLWYPVYPDRVPIRSLPTEQLFTSRISPVAPLGWTWYPEYPSRVPTRRVLAEQTTAGRLDPVAPLGWLFYPELPTIVPIRRLPIAADSPFLNPPAAAPTVPDLWATVYPDQVPHPRQVYQPDPTMLRQPIPTAEGWDGVYPDRVPQRRTPSTDGAFLRAPVVVPTFWAPSYPDLPPRRSPGIPRDLHYVRVPDPIIVPDFWAPSYPARPPRAYRIVPPEFFPGFEPIVLPPPSLPGRWSPQGPTYGIQERGSAIYRAQLVMADGITPLPGALLTSLRLTLYTIDTSDVDVIINGRNRQNVLNLNNVTVSPSGLVTWIIQPGDTAIVGGAPFERHIALFEWGWAGGQGKREIILVVRNLRQVP